MRTVQQTVGVIGGGASGLAAAIAAAQAGAAVTVLERLPRVGKKLLLTGNGRCNLANRDRSPAHYHGTVPQANRILAGFDPEAWFREMGLLIRSDSEGRCYPRSMTAASVLDALRIRATQCGAETLCDTRVTDILPQKQGFLLRSDTSSGARELRFDSVIAACGGSAAPSCGTDGSLRPVLERLGHRVVRPLPALCPIPVQSPHLKALKGLRVRCAVTARCGDRALKTESGELQFTETALSGICIFNLSRLAAVHGRSLTLSVDLLPELDAQAVGTLLRTLLTQRGDQPAGDLLTGLLPRRIGEVLLRSCGISVSAPADAMPQQAFGALAGMLRAWEFPVAGLAGFAQAQVAAGGISGQSSPRNLESKRCPGLFFCGELLDLDGDCGGYNLTWCWASGQTAGSNAAKS
jgi:predicted Rossmann fold flavoprotein